MISVDTNIVVPLLTGDDPGQHQKAVGLFGQKLAIVNAFRKLLGLSNVCAEAPHLLSQAFDWTEQGLILRTHSSGPQSVCGCLVHI